MTQGIQVDPGHRLRDLVAALSIIVLGSAVVMAVSAGEPPAPLRVPAILFGLGCAAITVAYSAGFAVDRLAAQFPGLTRLRRCPRALLWGGPLTIAALATTQVDAAAWVEHARGIATQVRHVIPTD